ncbi:MAG: glycosyltransferase family 9 protein, partial [Caulobacteraceae bacterium]
AGWSAVSLQVGPTASQAQSVLGVADLSPDLHDFDETAALVSNLDLVVAADTSTAHLAAALGKPTWLMLWAGAEWRWLANRTDSPWYPSLRIYRQAHPGDWTAVVARIAADLTAQRRYWSRRKRSTFPPLADQPPTITGLGPGRLSSGRLGSGGPVRRPRRR